MDLAREILGKNFSEYSHLLGDQPLALPDSYAEDDDFYGVGRYIMVAEKGLNIVIDPFVDIATALQFYSTPNKVNYSRYVGDIIPGLSLEYGRDEARAVLGAPVRVSEGGVGTGLMGADGSPWDLFRTNSGDINLTYSNDLSKITFASVSLQNDDIARANSDT